jgi:hypothetical protein
MYASHVGAILVIAYPARAKTSFTPTEKKSHVSENRYNAHQQLTQQWWDTQRQTFEVCVSPLVLQEISAGNPEMAQRRLEIVRGLSVLAVTQEATELAERLVHQGPLPPKAQVDALHIGVAAVQGMEYLLTWNCVRRRGTLLTELTFVLTFRSTLIAFRDW